MPRGRFLHRQAAKPGVSALARGARSRQPGRLAIGLVSGLLAVLGTSCIDGTRKQDLLHVDCLVAPDPGPCKGAFPGFYYDYQSDRCKSFTYGGCEGARPFESMQACLKTCATKR
jgi:hypothetical protein